MLKLILYFCVTILIGIILPLMIPGIGFWQIVLILGFFGLTNWMKSNKDLALLATILNCVVACFAIWIFVQSVFPMFSASLPFFWNRVDYEASQSIDKVRVKADITWDAYRTMFADSMLSQYRERLRNGDTKAAAAVEKEFYDRWNKMRIKDSLAAEEKARLTPPVTSEKGDASVSSHIVPSSSDISVTLSHGGEYTFSLKKGEDTGWMQLPEGKTTFSTSGSYDHEVLFSDGSVYDDGPSVVFPPKRNCQIKILATKSEVVRLVVS